MADERAHRAALIAAIAAAFGPMEEGDLNGAYAVDDAAVNGETLPDIYVTVHVSQRYTRGPDMVGKTRGVGWRVTTREVGRTVNEAGWARKRVDQALRDRRLTVAGEPTGRIRLETQDVIDLDDGRFSGATTWTYTS